MQEIIQVIIQHWPTEDADSLSLHQEKFMNAFRECREHCGRNR